MDKKQNLIWIDMEMTGLLPESDRIIEIATVISNKDLEIVAEGPVLTIHQPDEILDGMDDWNTEHHGDSGLTERVRSSRITEAEAEQQTLRFVSQYCEAGASPMCGNSIYQDRRFLARYMLELEAFFHYRHIDVSSVKELAKRWRPDVFEGLKKESAHRALEDIRDSIDELRHYRRHFFKMEK